MIAGPLGCFVVWRRMAYFGDSLAHSALLGVALGFLLSIELQVGVVVTCLAFALLIVGLQEQRRFATDTLLGLLSHSALALGLVAISLQERLRIDLMSYFFGDILAVTVADLLWIYGGGAVVLAGTILVWRPLLALTVHPDVAQAEGVSGLRTRLIFTLLLAGVVAIAMKIVGILLITSLLVIPAATARWFARTPEVMAGLACVVGAASVFLGLQASLWFDTPSGPSIVIAALALFLLVQALGGVASLVARRGSPWEPEERRTKPDGRWG